MTVKYGKVYRVLYELETSTRRVKRSVWDVTFTKADADRCADRCRSWMHTVDTNQSIKKLVIWVEIEENRRLSVR